MRIPLTLFLILIWIFLILAPINTFAEDISEESTPMLDIIPDNQFLLRNKDMYFKTQKFEEN